MKRNPLNAKYDCSISTFVYSSTQHQMRENTFRQEGTRSLRIYICIYRICIYASVLDVAAG